MPATFLRHHVEAKCDIDEARRPRGFQGDPRLIQDAVYSDSVSKKEYRCVMKNLYVPLTERQVRERLVKGRALSSLRWNSPSAHEAEAEPFAALPFDYCRVHSDPSYDAAILPFVGECNLEEVKTYQIGGDRNSMPAKIEIALRSPLARINVVRALATVLTAAEVRTRLSHLDVVDLNVRARLSDRAGTVRTYLIDWDDGLCSDGRPEPPNPNVYPWTPELGDAYRDRPWRLDCFALTRYLLWALSGSFEIQMTEQRNGSSRSMATSLATDASRLAVRKSEAVVRLLERIAAAADASRRRSLGSLDLLPTAAEFLLASRAESLRLTKS